MKRDFQDKTFKLCSEYQEFRQYITGIEDLEEFVPNEIIDENYDGIILDNLSRSQSLNILVDIEHQSSIDNRKMFRNLKYYVKARDKYEIPVRLYIFHTGSRLAPTYYIYDDQVFHMPYMRQTYEKNGMKTFKNIKNKLNHNKDLSPFDIFDFIWMPRFKNLTIDNEFLKEYGDVAQQLKDNKYYTLLKQVVYGWVHKLTNDEETRNYVKEKLEMMSTNSVEYKEYLATAMAERKIDDIKQEYEQQLQEKDKKITQTTQQLQEKDKEIKRLKQQLAKKE